MEWNESPDREEKQLLFVTGAEESMIASGFAIGV